MKKQVAEECRIRGTNNFTLSLAALGVVFGDIGTSPLYALRESFHPDHGIGVTQANVLGVLSLIFWSLLLVISVKYLVFILRADNRGEGGILSLTALATTGAPAGKRRSILILMGVFGTALLYGDGMITPAISVLSAVEGLEVATPIFSPYIIPITITVLVVLFSFQSYGTAVIGRIFGPVMLLWFALLAVLGIGHIVHRPEVLTALLPSHGFDFFIQNGWNGFVVLGSVFLVVTGGEALYSDLGHFGKLPIRFGWFTLVLPALMLNYLGQGALLLKNPAAVKNPFYMMAPTVLLYPVVILATVATVIASQALITGVFSLSMQAAQLGYIPRVTIRHTSSKQHGQIYISRINWLLLVACISLVIGFGSSTRLAAAYGVAVTTTMVLTTMLFYMVARARWNWSRFPVAALCGFFLAIDLSFMTATLLKITHGGWFPLAVGAVGLVLMATWRRGRAILGERLRKKILPVEQFVTQMETTPPQRLPGVGIFLTSRLSGTPPALLHTLDHFHALHETLVLLSVQTEEVPHVPFSDRVRTNKLGKQIYSITVHYGFMEDPDVHRDLTAANLDGRPLPLDSVTYVLGRENLIPTGHPSGMARWRERLFAAMSQNARSAADYFRLPAERVVEIGIRVEL